MLGRSIYKAKTITTSVIILPKFANNDEWGKTLMSEIIFDPVHKNVIFNLFQKIYLYDTKFNCVFMDWDVVRQFLNLCFGITEILKSIFKRNGPTDPQGEKKV